MALCSSLESHSWTPHGLPSGRAGIPRGVMAYTWVTALMALWLSRDRRHLPLCKEYQPGSSCQTPKTPDISFDMLESGVEFRNLAESTGIRIGLQGLNRLLPRPPGQTQAGSVGTFDLTGHAPVKSNSHAGSYQVGSGAAKSLLAGGNCSRIPAWLGTSSQDTAGLQGWWEELPCRAHEVPASLSLKQCTSHQVSGSRKEKTCTKGHSATCMHVSMCVCVGSLSGQTGLA